MSARCECLQQYPESKLPSRESGWHGAKYALKTNQFSIVNIWIFLNIADGSAIGLSIKIVSMSWY